MASKKRPPEPSPKLKRFRELAARGELRPLLRIQLGHMENEHRAKTRGKDGR